MQTDRPRRWIGAILFIAVPLIYHPALSCAADPSTTGPQAKMSLQHAIALGVVEGLTEYLPVSSTGHLVAFQRWQSRNQLPATESAGASEPAGEEKEAENALTICIQSGAILAVLLLYFQRLKQMVRGVLGGDPAGLQLLANLFIAFLPAAVLGILFHRIIKEHLLNIYSVTVAFAVGGLVILAVSRQPNSDAASPGKDLLEMSVQDAFVVGCFQCLAFWPGFSRSLATILGCRMVNLRMSAAVEFSFLLGLITLTAATAKEGLSHGAQIIEQYGTAAPAVALLAAFISAVISVKFMVTTLNRFGLTPFGYYRLILAGLCLLLWK